jgi:hypothetical protein
MEERDGGFPYVSVAIAAAAAIFVGHAATYALPATLGGMPTPGVMVIAVIGVVVAAVRWL